MRTSVFRAWSCTVRLVVRDTRVLPAATAELRSMLSLVDAMASRFRPHSALSQANRHAGRPFPIPSLLVDYVHHALESAAVTGGAVDPTVGLAMRRIGYDRDIASVPPSRARRPVVQAPTVDWHDVRLDREAGLLTVPAGCALDLGATAKAHTADLAAHVLAHRHHTAVLVEIGGDLAVAGDLPGGWRVRVAEREGQLGQVVSLRHGGIATSTTTVRRWTLDATPMHHIVNPRTGGPATEFWRTVSVHSQSALAANTASTAAIVLGAAAVPWLERRALAARLVDAAGSIHVLGEWPADALAQVA
jgi:FAD:protein FMN transferase